LQIQIRRAFVVCEVLTSSEIYDSCYARRRMLGQQIDRPYRWSVLRILRELADRVRRVPPHGAWLWRLKTVGGAADHTFSSRQMVERSTP
jgi:hypothetical protein